MRLWARMVLAISAAFVVGCSTDDRPDSPTVDNFDGRLTHNGKPVSFEAEKVTLKVFNQSNGESFGVPIQPDGTFDIGWMPIAKYSANLVRQPDEGGKSKKGGGANPTTHTVPGGFEIVEGKTVYEIELGKGFKP